MLKKYPNLLDMYALSDKTIEHQFVLFRRNREDADVIRG